MYSKLAILATAAFALFAAAAPTPNMPSSTCSTGPIQCCNGKKYDAGSPEFGAITGLLGGVTTGNILSNVFTGCSSLVGGSGCDGQTACCDKVDSNSLVGLNCYNDPIFD
ncbi:hypothetical protein AX14_006700 [Amanita brunnescens Koide BX004]|nr:hypothetical protein AX14_006700 [Amanita brunnescens Koide BX004]